jgi:hypothetical protein
MLSNAVKASSWRERDYDNQDSNGKATARNERNAKRLALTAELATPLSGCQSPELRPRRMAAHPA